MNKLVLSTALALSLGCTALCSAQSTPDAGTPITPMPNATPQQGPAGMGAGGMGQGRQMPSSDQMLTMISAKLALTDDQKAQIGPILAQRRQQLQALQSDTSSRPRQKMEKMKSIVEAADKQINPILTPDQRKQYSEMEAEQREKMKERMQERKAGGAPPQ